MRHWNTLKCDLLFKNIKKIINEFQNKLIK